jgi:hypothetical protein
MKTGYGRSGVEHIVCDFTLLNLFTEPFPHIANHEFIEPEIYRQLCETFPTCPTSTGPTGHSLYWGDADYERLLNSQRAWRALFETFHSQAFIDWARQQFHSYWSQLGCMIDLSKSRYVAYREDRVDKELSKLRVVEYEPEELWVRLDIHQGRVGYSRAIHVDHRRRLLSMLVYFCDQREIQMRGGELILHDAAKIPVKRITPEHNLMVAFPCSVNSTHSVAPITSMAAPRNYIQVHISSSVDIWDDSAKRKREGSPQSFSFPSSATPIDLSARSTERLDVEKSRGKLLRALANSQDITVIRNAGNNGDGLIHAGMRQLLKGHDYREVSIWQFGGQRGETAILTGSGAWCEAHQHLPAYLPRIEQQFERVIVFPTSFDTSVPVVRNVLSNTRALVFAREFASFEQIRELCKADVACDTAFFFDFAAYHRRGQGTLLAFRTDGEALTPAVPAGNNDIAITCESLDEFLWTIAQYEVINTDRAHVMIAAALLGKQVRFASSNYHKVPALAANSLSQYSIEFIPDLRERLCEESPQIQNTADASLALPLTEVERLRTLAEERGRVLEDLLNSKSYRIVSAYWRLRDFLSRR